MTSSRYLFILCVFSIYTANTFSSESAKEIGQVKTKEPKIQTVYNLRRMYAPFFGAAIGGLLGASCPAICNSLNKLKPEFVSPKELMGVSAATGALLSFLIMPHFLDEQQCSICGKTNKPTLEQVFAFLSFPLIGSICGAGLCALIHNFYPAKLPSQIGLKEVVIGAGAFGAAAGLSDGISYMQSGICDQCQKEKALSEL